MGIPATIDALRDAMPYGGALATHLMQVRESPGIEASGSSDGIRSMIIETKTKGTDATDDARSILLVHTASEDGLCTGCYEFSCVFAPFPCTQVVWARATLIGGGQQ
jgi:hypothetical protein